MWWKKFCGHPIVVAVGAIGTAVGAAGTIFGVPGMIEDWGVWQEWRTGAPWWFGFISGVGVTMLTLSAIHFCGPTVVIIYKRIVAFKKDPLRLLLVRKAYRATGNGIHIAKLIQKARSVETARDILDIFDGKERVADAYASYAQALVRFGYNIEAEAILRNLDDDPDISDIEIAEAMDRFLYPKDDGETVEDFADRLRKEPN